MPRFSPRRLAFAAFLALAALATACGGAREVLRLEPASAHERYAESLRRAGLDSTALGREWLSAADSALRAPLIATLPLREIGVYSRGESRAVAYRVSLREGQRLVVSLRTEGQPARVFLDLFEATGDTARPWRHRLSADSAIARDTVVERTLAWEARDSSAVVVRLHPELLRAGRFELAMRVEAILAFPVEGRGNAAIQSYFGAVRDGGRRDHHGIDIFAPRGTPVIAATDGVVRSTNPNNLGGNVVWLSDPERGQTLYYAHLDRHVVQQGQRVRTGDTIGFVGNTGNARSTPPHLHFGIYRRGRGAIDPLQYVRIVTARPPVLAADTNRLGSPAVVRVADAALRLTPSAEGATLRRASRETPLVITGATAGWYRVRLEDGTAAYIASSAVSGAGARLREFTGD